MERALFPDVYWGQVSAALAAAIGVAYWLSSRGESAGVAVLSAVIAYIVFRWVFAWFFRTRYWVNSNGRHSRSCPDCRQYIYRTRGDWVLRCHQCGWTAGWPLVRYLTRSVPVQQLRRTVVGPRLVIAVIAVGFLVTGAAGAIGVPDGSINVSVTDTPSAASPAASTTQSPNPTTAESSTPPGQEYNRTAVEVYFIELLNKERRDRGLQPVQQRDALTELGQDHSDNMAEHDYMGHIQPDGDTIENRYRDRGLLPECQLPIRGTDRYYPGTENVAQTWVEKNILGDATPDYIDSERDLAKHLFSMWMHSEGHREAMLVSSADQAGLGLNITQSDKVYASLELC